MRRIMVQRQPGQTVHKTLSQKKKPFTKRAGGVAEGVGPEFKPQYCKKKKKVVMLARHQWLTPVILLFRRQRSGGLWFEASPGK
jgi:hypothetical protein